MDGGCQRGVLLARARFWGLLGSGAVCDQRSGDGKAKGREKRLSERRQFLHRRAWIEVLKHCRGVEGDFTTANGERWRAKNI